jgi:hypothetical protein
VTGNNFDRSTTAALRAGVLPAFASLALFDGVYTTGGSIEKTKVWGFRGGYEHNWSPNWQTSVFGSYTHDRLQRERNGHLLHQHCCILRSRQQLQSGFQHLAGRFAHGMDPVKNLTFSGEVMYTTLDQRTPVAHCAGSWRGWLFKPAGATSQGSGHPVRQLRVRRTW